VVAFIGGLSRDERREVLRLLLEAADLPELDAHRRLTHAAHGDADSWMGAPAAAEYLALTVNALHKLTAARVIPFHQDGRGCKLWFKRSELDEWRRSGVG
jgi:excisionase family DNA binding protein